MNKSGLENLKETILEYIEEIEMDRNTPSVKVYNPYSYATTYLSQILDDVLEMIKQNGKN